VIAQKEKVREITADIYSSKKLRNAKERELFIKQRYFYVAAAIRDILRRYKKRDGHNKAKKTTDMS